MNFFSTVGALALFGLLTTLDHFGASQISDGEVYGNSTYCGNSTYSNCTITTNSTTSNSSSGGHQSHQLPRPPPPPKPAHIENHFEGKLFSAHGYPYQKFGHRVAANKDHIVVGTSIESLKPQVFVFSKDLEGNSSTAWKEIMFLESGKPSYDGFGLSLAVTNECLVIGAPNDDTWGYKSGKIYICHADPEGRFECRKSFHEEIYASSEMKKGAEYGHSLAISDVHLVVGAPGAIPNNSSIRTQSGLVDVFQKLGPRWALSQTLHDTSGDVFDKFGTSIALHRSLLAIGAPGKTSSEYSRLSTGAVFLYTNGGNNQTAQWMLETVLFPPAEEHALQFGYSLNCREGLCFIAATASQGEGVVYVYVKGTSDWQMMTKLMPVNSSPIDGFGTSIILYEANSASSIVKQAFSSSRIDMESPELRYEGIKRNNGPATLSSSQYGINSTILAIIGAPGDDDLGDLAGAIYVYASYFVEGAKTSTKTVSYNLRSDSTFSLVKHYNGYWDLLGKITCNDTDPYTAYGQSLAVVGHSTLIVGAELATTRAAQLAGAVYVEDNLLTYMASQAKQKGGDDVISALYRALGKSASIFILAFVPAVALAAVIIIRVRYGPIRKHNRYTHPGTEGAAQDESKNDSESSNPMTEDSREEDMEFQVDVDLEGEPSGENPEAPQQRFKPNLIYEWITTIPWYRRSGDTKPEENHLNEQEENMEEPHLDYRIYSDDPGSADAMSIRSPVTIRPTVSIPSPEKRPMPVKSFRSNLTEHQQHKRSSYSSVASNETLNNLLVGTNTSEDAAGHATTESIRI